MLPHVGAAILSLVGGSEAFLLMARHLAHERVDPIVNPGNVSGHLHDVVGGSKFGITFSPNIQASSSCSTMEIQENLSNYWMPALMAQNDNGTFSAVPIREVRVYYLNNHSQGTKLKAFPRGLRMLAGDPSAIAPVKNDPKYAPARHGFLCQMGGTDKDLEKFQYTLPNFDCKDFLRLTVNFPDCWNGVDLDSKDHKSHMAYRLNNGKCPDDHPVPMMEIDLEIGYQTRGFRADQLLLSTGDKAGYGIHADYLSFWDVNLLQKALDDPTCQHRENISHDGTQCKTLAGFSNTTAQAGCKLQTDIPQERAGIILAIPSLPGCNEPYDSRKGEKKPVCSSLAAVPHMGPPTEFVNFSTNKSPVPIPVYSK